MPKLKNLLGLQDIAQAERPKGFQAGILWQTVAGKLGHREAEKNLFTMGGLEQARQAVKASGEIVSITWFSGSRMERHADTRSVGKIWPGFLDETSLSIERRGHALGCGKECRLRTIANSLEADSAMHLNRVLDDRELAINNDPCRGSVAFPLPRAALDISKEEGDGTAW
jgi:hypothetical protein